MIVYLARDIPAFVMYCVNGASRSSLLIESTYSMILYTLDLGMLVLETFEERILTPVIILITRECVPLHFISSVCSLFVFPGIILS